MHLVLLLWLVLLSVLLLLFVRRSHLHQQRQLLSLRQWNCHTLL
jgi:hypothetical protein